MDMYSTALLPEVVPEIDANPASFYSGGGVGHGLELPYVKFKVTITEFAYKFVRQFEENIRHSTVIASYYFTTIDKVTISCCVTVVVQWGFPENVRGYNLCLFSFFLFSATSHYHKHS